MPGICSCITARITVPIGVSPALEYPSAGQHNSPARKRFRQQWPIFELRVAQRNGHQPRDQGLRAERQMIGMANLFSLCLQPQLSMAVACLTTTGGMAR